MDFVLIFSTAFIGGVIVGVIVEHYVFKKDTPSEEDNIKKIQALIDKVDNINEDIKNTV